ncbi:MAG: ATP-binding cassette domain-containing protein, partial [Planctomycetota bacterium]
MPYRLEVRQIRKTYPGVVALDDVSLGVNDGEVLAVIGENGAGKSTLMKIMAGIVEPDEGMILLDERQVSFANPSEAIRSGVSLIHQELNLHENLSVAENLFLGREPSRYGWLDRGEMFRRSEGYLEQVGLPIAPRTSLSQLNTASRQLVEVAKAISTDARVIIMDEPTSSLSIQETQRLFDVVGRLRRSGV